MRICIVERTDIIRIELQQAFVILVLNKELIVRLVIGITTSLLIVDTHFYL